jgi:photosystem II stability/assembly factor-like uncharacterized protein
MKRIFTLAILLLSFYFSSNAQWVKTNGPKGITFTEFFEYNDILFCGSYAQGVFKSLDNGLTWSASNAGLENKWILSFEKDSLYLYAGTQNAGLYRSSDNGATWSAANTGMGSQAVNCLLAIPGHLFAGTVGSGLFRSDDNANTWVDANGGALGSSYIHSMVNSSQRLMVEADNYIFFTINLGNTWDVDNGPTAFWVIQNFLQQGDTILAAARNTVFLTTDGGLNWSNAITVDPVISILGFDRRADTIYAGYSNSNFPGFANGLYYTLNWGLTWTPVSSTGTRFGIRDDGDFIISGTNFLFSCEEIGVYYSQDFGATWLQTLSEFPPASTVNNAMLVIGDSLYAGTHNNGVHASYDDGNTWNRIGTPNPQDTLSNSKVFAMLSPAPGILLAGTCSHGLYRSADYGSTWTHITSGLPLDTNNQYCCINALTKAGNNVVAATTEGMYYSTDNGLTWNSTNLSGYDAYAGGVAANGNIVVAGISSFSFGSGFYRSINSGVTWTNVYPGSFDVVCMGADGGTHMYAGSFFSNYYSADNGLNWNFVGPGIPPGSGGFAIHIIDSNVFIGNSAGVFYSANHAASFTDISIGLDPYPNNVVQGLTNDYDNLYAGTFRDAVWKRPLAEIGIVLNTTTVQNELHFNLYPNPSNGVFEIQYQGSDKNISVKIFNSMGQQVLNQLLQNNFASFNLTSLPPGTYIVILISNNGMVTKKLVIE